MRKSTIYCDIVKHLLIVCKMFKQHEVDLDYLKNEIWLTAEAIVASDESKLRKFLQSAEGQLDIIEFTTDSDKKFDVALSIVDGVMEELASWIQD